MTNEQAAKVLIKAISNMGGQHDEVDEALQIAIYALSYASGSGIQFDKPKVEMEKPTCCDHFWNVETRFDEHNYRIKCKYCGETRPLILE